MKPLTSEWVDKAEADFATASREARVRKAPNYDAVCFHAQQCAEKYLKARLQEADIPFTRSHDLVNLLRLLEPVEPTWSSLRPALRVLNQFAVEYRYPGSRASQSMAKDAMVHCGQVRKDVRASLGLPE